jgi:hypothetical protein
LAISSSELLVLIKTLLLDLFNISVKSHIMKSLFKPASSAILAYWSSIFLIFVDSASRIFLASQTNSFLCLSVKN